MLQPKANNNKGLDYEKTIAVNNRAVRVLVSVIVYSKLQCITYVGLEQSLEPMLVFCL
jgi:hypothetical protein